VTSHAPDDLLTRASLVYTAGSQRQAIFLAHWLLGGYRTEDELCEQLQHVFDEIFPPRRKAMLDKALSKLKTKSAKEFMKGCRKSSKKRARTPAR